MEALVPVPLKHCVPPILRAASVGAHLNSPPEPCRNGRHIGHHANPAQHIPEIRTCSGPNSPDYRSSQVCITLSL